MDESGSSGINDNVMNELEMNQIVNYSQSELNILTTSNGNPSINNYEIEIDAYHGNNNFGSN